MLKYCIFTILLFFLFWQISRFNYIAPKERSVEFLDSATSFYQPHSIEKTILPNITNEIKQKNFNQNLQVYSVEVVEKKMTELYQAPQEELAGSLSLLIFYQKQLELALALKDQAIDHTSLMEPHLKIALAAYLEISPNDMSDRYLKDTEIPNQTMQEIVKFSQSNDFRILLLQGKLTKEEIDKHLK